MELLMNPLYIWLIAGAALIAFEAFTTPGLGIFLAGLGAICTGLIIKSGFVDPHDIALQFVYFFGFTILCTAILWKPLMKFRTSGKNKTAAYSDIVGGIATVGKEGLKRGELGQVLWSGTIMNAELDNSAKIDFVPAGTQVIIKSVTGNTFKVTPK